MLKQGRGFTLIEAMVVLALLAILASIATPGFTQMIHAQQLRSASIDLALAFTTARHEAITRQRPVLIDNGDGEWASGWRIFVDQNANGALDEGELVLRTGDASTAGVRISGNTPVSRYVRYTPSGLAKMQNGAFQAGTITLCHADGEQPIRKLVLSATGRLRTVKEAAGSC
ncbi:type IV fimbrial biogenesis protein FimT [Pseudomonas linyingensis]|uniref:Type II secretion system protein H n=1 Tax=Pseudomonas linyingensis TaxID=915471 RepID=A0A1H6YAB0_9PSED|nr:GspH/FimT family pseudopilin [Pseudomonas linyingensis]SEJ33705.1 type IV fimbrial biogenesis protein FimT [Pseudomonas linyingensis]